MVDTTYGLIMLPLCVQHFCWKAMPCKKVHACMHASGRKDGLTCFDVGSCKLAALREMDPNEFALEESELNRGRFLTT
jgi:hypothetical protein